ncbi:hypothetical protein [Paenibacillus sp. HB172176]|uniref:hypothetical protein n=1 Tax=Paenibacillus sp. HB172176 TaxID=2493690 RepID=UPI00143A7BEE|nr:hypothetical protein [Paenibacillus sp. HB172176]
MNRRFFVAIVSILFILAAGCSANNTNNTKDQAFDQLDVSHKVNLWNSIQYEEITEINAIRAIEPDAENGNWVIRYSINLENRGEESAKNFQAAFRAATPFSYIRGTGGQGSDNGELKPDDTHELYGYYLFDSKDKMEDFIQRSTLLLEWTENEVTKQMILKFPDEPTQ